VNSTRPPKRDYGASQRLKCKCGSTYRIKSREPHPERGARYERQTFACSKCGAVETRDVFTPGGAEGAS